MYGSVPVILNLHHFKRDSYIAGRMSGLNYRWKAEDTVAVTHLAHTLGVKIQESAFRGRDSIAAIESFLFDFFSIYAIIHKLEIYLADNMTTV